MNWTRAPRIEPAEYGRRLGALRAAVRGAGLDVHLVSAFDGIYYLTGTGFEPLERPFFLLVWPDRPPALVVPRLDREHMQQRARTVAPDSVHTYWEYPAPGGRTWLDRLRVLLGSARAVGVEPGLRLDLALQLAEWAPRAEPLVDRLRVVKSPAEVAMVRRAARYADLGVERLLAASYAGSTEAEGFAQTRAVTARIIREVDDWEPLTTRVTMATWAAPRSALPHSIPALWDRLGPGPHVALVLARVNGYSAESERTYFTTPPSAEMRRAFAAMLQARAAAFARVRPGARAAEIDEEVNAFLGREYPAYQTEGGRLHRTGHGIGLSTHEGPWLAAGSPDVLVPNMVISIEPGVYVPGLGGCRHSDTVLVTKTGYELLTRLPTDLASLTLRGWRPMARLRGRFIRRALRVAHKERVYARCPVRGECPDDGWPRDPEQSIPLTTPRVPLLENPS